MNNFLSDTKFDRGVPVKGAVPAKLWFRRTLLVLAGGLSLALCFSSSLYAQEQSAQEADAQDVTEAETNDPVPPQPLPEKEIVRLDQMQENIGIQKEDLVQLEGQIDEAEGLARDIFVLRRDRLWTEMFQGTLNLAKDVSKQKANNMDVSAYHDVLLADLSVLPAEAYGAMDRLLARVVFPSPDLATEDFVIADQKLFIQLIQIDAIYTAFIAYILIADDFGLDAAEDRENMIRTVQESAANRSIFMEKALLDAKMLQASVATLPGNTNLADWLRAVQTRIQLAAKSMNDIIPLMTSLGIESRQYRRQVLTVTGEITTDVLDISIIANLLSDWGEAIGSLIAKEGPKLLVKLLIMTLIIFGFAQLAKVVQRLVRSGMNAAQVRISYLLKEMILSSVRNLVILLGILIALAQMGVSLGPLLAGLGIAGFIIGFALQDSLANFASGMLILLYRPFDVGDFVDAAGVRGKVKAMSLVNTTFHTLDNQRLVVPNNLIWGSVITNVTAQRTRRVDLVFGISYEDDVEKAEKVLQGILDDHEAVLEDPEPIVRVLELGDSSVNFAVRPWVKTADYWETYWDLTKKVKLKFDEEGISIPYPQRDVHVKEQKPV
jgi:small conductance mechanosensitive channel